MDPIRNPYAPGAGTPPPELAGRDEIREAARIALERIRIGRSGKSLMLVGLRGAGKTVLLTVSTRTLRPAAFTPSKLKPAKTAPCRLFWRRSCAPLC